MKALSRWQWMYRVGRWRAAGRRAVLCALSGGTLGLTTVVLGAVNAVSAQQVIALALPAVVLTVGGLITGLVPDSWTAWRRGFRQGCRVAAVSQPDGMNSECPAVQGRQSQPGLHAIPPTAWQDSCG
jgi:hypothetical protein